VPDVLICGSDETLAKVRAEVLRAAGFNPQVKVGWAELESVVGYRKPHLLVLCSSLPFAERYAVDRWVSEKFADIRTLVILRNSDPATHFNGEVLLALSGPKALVEAAQRLTQ
jgi:hypothetical protein